VVELNGTKAGGKSSPLFASAICKGCSKLYHSSSAKKENYLISDGKEWLKVP
jgi:hypothetical protein